ncbi:MAG: amidophosphoribosyltransferase [Bacteroidetes bacterium]|nr:amidophosphoribosyltransferase [Bacteroidota bacterium]MDA0943574.1 amidophosphoribosyltransferase [Bacteroidota bacterium]MDA1111805.1 amidophosphoribosyltransferase [Bacteroidota bacterium]
MSDAIKHECGVAFIRLRKPLEYYKEKYGTYWYGLQKLQFLMTKQLNRGQDGAGIGVVKLDPDYGARYLARKRSASKTAISDVFDEVYGDLNAMDGLQREDLAHLKKHYPYAGELLLGHLRYGTYGGNSIENIHPFLRQNNWMARNLMLAGNYNVTNTDELFNALIELGQQPKEKSDNVLMLEKIGHFIDEENQRLFGIYKAQGYDNLEIAEKIKNEINLRNVLKRSFKNVDGGYNMVGMLGHGDAFVMRDPAGIRPSHYYVDDEVVVVASERAPIMTAFNVPLESIQEIKPGHALIVKRDGSYSEEKILAPVERKSCSFERIYFSRGSDKDIYHERKELGRLLAGKVLNMIDFDLKNTVFSYVPNTASTSFYGLVDGLNEQIRKRQLDALYNTDGCTNPEALKEVLAWYLRREKVLVKDAKMRTFITNDTDREGLVGHVYDVTYGIVQPDQDTLVIMDDSVVRGTTLRTSILRILDRLRPKRIILVSSAPQIRYPDCYGIDMSRLGDFAAFQAAIALLKDRGMESLLQDLYAKAKEELAKPASEQINVVKELYAPFSADEITDKIAEMVQPKDLNARFDMVFQSIENLHQACPNDKGDWYFTGDYPTPGGTQVANRSFLYYMEGSRKRAY